MGVSVAIVTDSTSYLPAHDVSERGITVVPLQVVVGGAVKAEGVDIGPQDAAHALRAWLPVTTSRPTPAQFSDAYAEAARSGATGVVSLHLSAEMSGTVESARLAAADAPIPVKVIDTRSIGMGLGYPVLTAAATAATGAALDDVAAAATRRAETARTLFYVDTLEHLRRGGRIGAAATLVGSALMVKPLLHIEDGRIAPLEKVRTATRAMARLEELAAELAGTVPVDVTVHHLAAPAPATALADRLRDRIPALTELYVGEVGAVIGAHVGPGMLAVVVAPHEG
jgi:DegV family protein with EDD domain